MTCAGRMALRQQLDRQQVVAAIDVGLRLADADAGQDALAAAAGGDREGRDAEAEAAGVRAARDDREGHSRLRRPQRRHELLLSHRAARIAPAVAIVGLVLLVFRPDAAQLLDRRRMQVDAQVDVGIGCSSNRPAAPPTARPCARSRVPCPPASRPASMPISRRCSRSASGSARKPLAMASTTSRPDQAVAEGDIVVAHDMARPAARAAGQYRPPPCRCDR